MLDNQTFAKVVELTPLVSLDLVVVRCGSEVLLGLRHTIIITTFEFALKN